MNPYTRAALAEAYRRHFGCFVELDGHDRITLVAATVHAIQVCSILAEPVLHLQHREGLRTPVIDNTATGSRTFLTTAPPPRDLRPVQFAARGTTLNAARTVHGSPISLPTPDDERWTWRTDWRTPLAPFDHLAHLVSTAVTATASHAA